MRKRTIRVLLILVVAVCGWMRLSFAQTSPSQTPVTAKQQKAPQAEKPITEYTLPPDLHQKAHALYRTGIGLAFLGFFYSVGLLIVLLKFRVAPRIRDMAEGK